MPQLRLQVRLKQDQLTPALQRLQRGLSGIGARRILSVMGRRFLEITRHNFGPTGEDRPIPWSPLSRKYAKRVTKRSFNNEPVPTLLRSGTLLRSIHLTVTDQSAVISTESPYSAKHQIGFGGTPSRPYFPVIHGTGDTATLTPHAEAEITKAALQEIDQIIK